MDTYKLPYAVRALGGIKDAYSALFLANDDIREIIMPRNSDLYDQRFSDYENWRGGRYTTRQNGKSETVELVGHCFDVPFIRDTITDNRMMICMDTYYNRAYTQQVKDIVIMINVFGHKESLVSLTDEDRKFLAQMHQRGYTGNRLDMAVAAITQAVLTAHEVEDKDLRCTYGIGGASVAQREGIQLYSPNVNFYGKQLHFEIPEFNVTPNTIQIKN